MRSFVNILCLLGSEYGVLSLSLNAYISIILVLQRGNLGRFIILCSEECNSCVLVSLQYNPAK